MRKKKTIFNPLLSKRFQDIDENIYKLEDWVEDVGTVRTGVDLVTSSGMTLDLSGGTLRRYNRDEDAIEDQTFLYVSGLTFDIIDIQGNILTSGATEVDFSQINQDGDITVTTLPQNNDASFVQFYIDWSGDVKMLIGQKLYSNISLARQTFFTEKKTLPALLDGYVHIGGYLGRKNAIDLNLSTVYQVFASKLSEENLAGGVTTPDVIQYTGDLGISGSTTLGSILSVSDISQGLFIRAYSLDGNDVEITLPNEDQTRIITNVGTNGSIIVKDSSANTLASIPIGETYNAWQREGASGAYNLHTTADAETVREFFDTPASGDTIFTIVTTFPSNLSTVNVFRNGLLQREGATNDYTFGTQQVILTYPIDTVPTQERVEVSWMTEVGTELRQTYDAPAQNQVNITYTLNAGVLPTNTDLIRVYRNGILQREGATNDYTVSGSNIVLNTAIDNTSSQESIIIITNN